MKNCEIAEYAKQSTAVQEQTNSMKYSQYREKRLTDHATEFQVNPWSNRRAAANMKKCKSVQKRDGHGNKGFTTHCTESRGIKFYKPHCTVLTHCTIINYSVVIVLFDEVRVQGDKQLAV